MRHALLTAAVCGLLLPGACRPVDEGESPDAIQSGLLDPAVDGNMAPSRSPDDDQSVRPSDDASETPVAKGNGGEPSDEPVTEVAEVDFTVERGFYDAPFDLIIESATAGATIVWTLDGSDPRLSATADTAPSPATLRIDPSSTAGRDVTPGVVVRTYALRDGMEPTAVATQTYIFIEQVLRQPTSIGPNWPTYEYTGPGGPSVHDYGMDQAIVEDPAYTAALTRGLLDIPSLSIVMTGSDFWDVYRSADEERPASFEVFGPDLASVATDSADWLSEQVDGGLEPHSHDRTKRSLRMVFRSSYGAGDWETDLFKGSLLTGESAPDEVDRVVLRAGNNRSWARSWNPEGTAYTVDEWYRATQQALSGYGAHGAFVHLYVNGIYWGLYNPVERPDRHLAARRWGGDHEDWSAVSHGGLMGGDEARWQALTAFGERPLQGGDLSILHDLIDVPAFCDYLLLAWYIGIRDWPGNNWWALGRNEPPGPFRFMAWDGEWSFGNGYGSPDRPRVHPNMEGHDEVGDGEDTPIGRLFNAIKRHPDVRMACADRAALALGDGGALADDATLQRWATVNQWIERAVVAESARWGDALIDGRTRTRDKDWRREVSFIENYMRGAADELLSDLVRHGYYPSVASGRPYLPPRLMVGGQTSAAYAVALPVPDGDDGGDQGQDAAADGQAASGEIVLNVDEPLSGERIVYSLEGDPRAPGGALLPEALGGGGNLALPQRTSKLYARRLIDTDNGIVWSPLLERLLVVGLDWSALRISEIHYHPAEAGLLEFLELHNTGSSPLDLGGVRFSDGIRFEFPLGTLLTPDGYLVLAADPQRLEAATGHSAFGAYEGRLDNGGERLAIADALGRPILEVTYDDDHPWPAAADGDGPSLVPAVPWRAGSDPEEWRTSAAPGGSPGKADPAESTSSD